VPIVEWGEPRAPEIHGAMICPATLRLENRPVPSLAQEMTARSKKWQLSELGEPGGWGLYDTPTGARNAANPIVRMWDNNGRPFFGGFEILINVCLASLNDRDLDTPIQSH
jgi:hypothetical protein